MISCEEYIGITDEIRGEDSTEAVEPVQKNRINGERVTDRE